MLGTNIDALVMPLSWYADVLLMPSSLRDAAVPTPLYALTTPRCRCDAAMTPPVFRALIHHCIPDAGGSAAQDGEAEKGAISSGSLLGFDARRRSMTGPEF
ncbi:hypothetical protein A0U90_13170 (plasmid) [Kozakia baliensis]|nr:hypothetical protein A0U90_13170 [Kozakia baliensis]